MRYVAAMADKFPEVTPFSKEFGAALGDVMEDRGVSQSAVARAIEKKAGASYVSERVRGLRAVDTDVIAGVAMVANTTPQAIVREVLAKMRGTGATVHELPAPKKPSPAPVKKAASTDRHKGRPGS